METITRFFIEIYFQCTDFVINVANLTGTSYYEINFFLFCVLYPVLFFGGLTYYWIQQYRLRKVKNLKQKSNLTQPGV